MLVEKFLHQYHKISSLIVFFVVYLYLKTGSTLKIKEESGQEYLTYHAQKS